MKDQQVDRKIHQWRSIGSTKEGKRKLARKFNLSCRYIDDLISLNNKTFNEFISDIYPKELTISETTDMRTTTLPPNYMTNVMRLVSTL